VAAAASELDGQSQQPTENSPLYAVPDVHLLSPHQMRTIEPIREFANRHDLELDLDPEQPFIMLYFPVSTEAAITLEHPTGEFRTCFAFPIKMKIASLPIILTVSLDYFRWIYGLQKTHRSVLSFLLPFHLSIHRHQRGAKRQRAE
jgi:hypothetical protein